MVEHIQTLIMTNPCKGHFSDGGKRHESDAMQRMHREVSWMPFKMFKIPGNEENEH